MKELDRPVISSSATLHSLETYKRLWWSGWVVAGLTTWVACYMAGSGGAYRRAVKDIEKAKEDLVKVQSEQEHLTASFVIAWEVQQQSTRLVVSWAEYLKQRDDLVSLNKKSIPYEFVVRRK